MTRISLVVRVPVLSQQTSVAPPNGLAGGQQADEVAVAEHARGGDGQG